MSGPLESESTDLFCCRLQILKDLLSSSENGLDLLEDPLAHFLFDCLKKCQEPTDEMFESRDSLYSPLLQVAAQLPARFLENISDHETMTVALDLRCEFAKTVARSNPKETGSREAIQ